MDHGPVKAEGEGLEPPSGPCRHLFSRQVPHPAGCLPLANKLRGLESNQRPPGSEPGVTTSSNYPGSLLSRDTRKSPQARGEGFEPSPPASKAGRLPLADPRSLRSALWESNPPRQLGRLEPLPLGQGHLLKAEGVRVELTRLLRSTAFEAVAIADWLALPFCHQAPVGGIEPPIFGLTGRRLTVWPHRIMSVRTAGFEPAISCSRGTRNTRLSYVLIRERPAGVEPGTIRRMVLPPWQGGRLPLHHGRLVGSRIVKDPRAPGGTRTLVAALRKRCLRR